MNAMPSYLPAEPSRPRRKGLLIAGAILAILCLCASAYTGLFNTILSQKAPLEASIDAFMQALSSDDFDGAYAQFSARAKQGVKVAEFEEYFSQRANRALVAGYQSAEIENINLSWKAETDATKPQGQVAEVDGTLAYQGGYTGTFSAILEREGSEWRIYGFDFNVTPEKVEDYLKGAS